MNAAEKSVTLGFAIGLALLFMLMAAMLASARAHVHGLSDKDNAWLAQQGSSVGVCCTGSEALTLVDPDWCEALEGKCANQEKTVVCKLGPGQRNMVTGLAAQLTDVKYCVHLGHTWWAVPENAVVKAANRIGPAIVWPVFADTSFPPNPEYLDEYGDPILNYIRCFLKGAET